MSLAVERNLGLVWGFVHYYAEKCSTDANDIFQEGVIGLIKAIGKWDPARGAFSTVAHLWIRESITNFLYRKSHLVRQNGKHDNTSPVSDEYLADAIGKGNASTLSSSIVDDVEAVVLQSQKRRLMEDAIDELDPVRRMILRLRYGFDGDRRGMTLTQIGEVMGWVRGYLQPLTRERVRQLERDALSRLRRDPRFADITA